MPVTVQQCDGAVVYVRQVLVTAGTASTMCNTCARVFMHVYVARDSMRMCVCVYACVYIKAPRYVCTYACTYVRMYVRMYVLRRMF
jgi:hypothetical protein